VERVKIEIYLEENEMGTPIEIANGIIKTYLDKINDLEMAEIKKSELSEIAEHIQVFLKYSKGE
jgi:hypothetical protein